MARTLHLMLPIVKENTERTENTEENTEATEAAGPQRKRVD
jgi:hypothetical protein